jgi:UPF0176 protein
MKYTVLLYYRYVTVPDPAAERDAQRRLCSAAGLRGRILIGDEGINGTVAGEATAVQEYLDYMNGHELFAGIHYKIDTTDVMPFPKLKIKVRPEIVTLGLAVDVDHTATHITPEQFNEMIKDPEVVLFDARNNYESAIGRFKGAITPDIGLFSDFPQILDEYEALKDKRVIAYCTGGIRCEKASALMKQQGFKNVYQLDGGIINYAQSFPDGAYEGECFVFDGRMSMAFNDTPAQLGRCVVCDGATNRYYNCGVKSCNKLILVCDGCRQPSLACGEDCRSQLTAIAGSR